MSTNPSAQDPNAARVRTWSNLSTPQIVALAVSGAFLLICCIGSVGAMLGGADSESPSDFESETESSSEESPSPQETTSRPEPTAAPTTEAAIETEAPVEAEVADEGDGASEVYYENCDAARDAGAAPVHEWEEGYGEHLDGDGDGVGCEDSSGAGSDSGGNGGGGSDEDDDGGDVYYKNCDAARAAGAAPVHAGEPGYGSHLDRDGDGVGCE